MKATNFSLVRFMQRFLVYEQNHFNSLMFLVQKPCVSLFITVSYCLVLINVFEQKSNVKNFLTGQHYKIVKAQITCSNTCSLN